MSGQAVVRVGTMHLKGIHGNDVLHLHITCFLFEIQYEAVLGWGFSSVLAQAQMQGKHWPFVRNTLPSQAWQGYGGGGTGHLCCVLA